MIHLETSTFHGQNVDITSPMPLARLNTFLLKLRKRWFPEDERFIDKYLELKSQIESESTAIHKVALKLKAMKNLEQGFPLADIQEIVIFVKLICQTTALQNRLRYREYDIKRSLVVVKNSNHELETYYILLKRKPGGCIIGKGGSKTVYLLIQVKNGQAFEKAEEAIEPGYDEQVLKENEFVKNFNSPHIVKCALYIDRHFKTYSHSYSCEKLSLVKPLYQGDFTKMKALNFTLKEQINAMAMIIFALLIVHKANCLHRDIKPLNMFIDWNKIGILGDFGIAVKETDSFINHTTPAYAPPGYYNSETKQDKTWDLYALGKSILEVFFELCSYTKESKITRSIESKMKTIDPMLQPTYQTIYKEALLLMQPQSGVSLEEVHAVFKSLV